MGEEPDSASEGGPLTDGVESEHRHPTRGRCHQPCTQPEQAGLPGPVRAFDQQGLAQGDLEIDAGKKGEPPRQRDRVVE